MSLGTYWESGLHNSIHLTFTTMLQKGCHLHHLSPTDPEVPEPLRASSHSQ